MDQGVSLIAKCFYCVNSTKENLRPFHHVGGLLSSQGGLFHHMFGPFFPYRRPFLGLSYLIKNSKSTHAPASYNINFIFRECSQSPPFSRVQTVRASSSSFTWARAHWDVHWTHLYCLYSMVHVIYEWKLTTAVES